MEAKRIGTEWVQIGMFASKIGLITNLWLNFRDTTYHWDPLTKQNIVIPGKSWTLMAAVKNSGSHFACAFFNDQQEAFEALSEALHLI